MNNYWLNHKKKCGKRWKRIEIHSNNCSLIMKDETPTPWDFKEALKDTVIEKYETDHIKVVEIDGNKLSDDAMIVYPLVYGYKTPSKDKIN